jgi:hypothetical protein
MQNWNRALLIEASIASELEQREQAPPEAYSGEEA